MTFDRLRQLATDIAYPVTFVVTRPIGMLQDGLSTIRDYLNLRSDNLRYQAEIERLGEMERENRMLRQKLENYQMLLGRQPETEIQSVAANVMFDPGGPFVRTYVLDVGVSSGVVVGDPVIGVTGLVGRIVSVGAMSSRVLLLTDLNSRIPVRVEPSGVNAILAGSNTNRPQLLFYSENASFNEGDSVTASGLGGQIPRGTLIGRIRINQAGAPEVDLSEKPENLSFVRILQPREDLDLADMENIPELLDSAPEADPPQQEMNDGL